MDVARAIVVLATAESPERSDARVLRIVLSLMGVHDRLEKAGRGGLQVLHLFPPHHCYQFVLGSSMIQMQSEERINAVNSVCRSEH